jgi:hypothetical protein
MPVMPTSSAHALHSGRPPDADHMCAQVGGLVLCMLVIDLVGRRRCLWIFMLGAMAFTTPLLRDAAPVAGGAESPVDIAALFFTRLFAYAAFIALFIYTPELYPTKIRSFAFGVFNALCRLGGLIAPFVAVDLFEHVRPCSACALLMRGWRCGDGHDFQQPARDCDAPAGMLPAPRCWYTRTF